MGLEDQLYPLLRSYERLPQSLQRLIGSTYRVLPERVRLGRRYSEFQKVARAFEDAHPDDIRAYQLNRVREITAYAYESCPFYRKRFDRAGFNPSALDDLEVMKECPATSKRDLQDHLGEMSSSTFDRRHRLYITTGGSTGTPVGFYLHKGVSRAKEQAFLETMWARAGYRTGARMAVIRGMVTSSRSGGRMSYHDATRNWLILSSYHLTRDRIQEYFDALVKFRPRFLHAYPSAVLMLARFMRDVGLDLPIRLGGVLCGSEQMTRQQKETVEQSFGCRAYRWYGHSERVVLAGEGRRSNLFYFFPTYGYTEFGPPDGDGYQEVIGTSFDNRAMPLIRYRTGDMVRWAEETDLEFPWTAAESVVGRRQEFLLSATGRRISLTALNMHDDVFDGLYAIQFVQEKKGSVECRYVPSDRFDEGRVAVIESRIREKLGDDFSVRMSEVREVEKTAAGKHKWLVSSLDDEMMDGVERGE